MPTRLRFVAADHLECSGTDLDGAVFQDVGGQKLGDFCGVIVDPEERRVRYFVIERGGLIRRRYMLPLMPAQLTDAVTLRPACHERTAPYLREFDADAVPEFSDEDLIDAMFAPVRRDEHLPAA